MIYEIKQKQFTSKYTLPTLKRDDSITKSPSFYYTGFRAWNYVKKERDCHDIIARICEHCGTKIVGSWKYDCVNFDQVGYDWNAQHWQQWEKLTSEEYRVISSISDRNGRELERIEDEVKNFLSIEDCPICKAKLLDKEGYIRISGFRFVDRNKYRYATSSNEYKAIDGELCGDLHGVDAVCKWLDVDMHCRDYELAEEKTSKLIRQYNSKFAKSKSNIAPSTIKSNPDTLTEYLLKLIKIETTIYGLTEWLTDLYVDQRNAQRFAYGSTFTAVSIAEKQLSEAQQRCEQQEIALKALKAKGPERVNIPMPSKPEAPVPPVLATPGFFNKKKVLAQNAFLTNQYEVQVIDYKVNLEEYERKLADRNEQIKLLTAEKEEKYAAAIAEAESQLELAKEALEQRISIVKECQSASSDVATPEKAQKALVDSEVAKAENTLMQLVKCKHELYNCNVIFAKYRNPVALATFYEYLVAGRCSTLDGAKGAYNLYEAEIRADRIIAQLDDVIDALEEIQERQYMIYSELSEVNRNLDSLKNTMQTAVNSIGKIEVNTRNMNAHLEHIAQNSDVIAHNTAVNAYYSEINAELTDALGYMIALH